MTSLGIPIAYGSRSVVHEWGSDCVAKVPLPNTPEGWIRYEALYAEAVWMQGAPAPRFHGLEVIEGREVSIYERLYGPSLWDAIVREPDRVEEFGRQLAQLHLQILPTTPPITLPSQRSRIVCKLTNAVRRTHPSLGITTELVPSRPEKMALCHGDFHPNNVIVTDRGLVVVDWFDASRGDACAEIARTMLLLYSGDETVMPQHLPHATTAVLVALQRSYFEVICDSHQVDLSRLALWQLVQSTARLAEGVDPTPLVETIGRFLHQEFNLADK
jgi:Phosphotransferase enzyme family